MPRAARREALTALLLAAAGVVVALITFGDSLVGDEVFTEWVVDRSPGGILEVLRTSPPGSPESSPPLYFLVARAFSAIAGFEVGLRLPSLLAVAATAGLVHLLARRAFSSGASVLATALWSLSPFVAFYAVEARPYALLMCLTAASTLALFAALGHGGRRRWALWAVLAAAATLTHYTAIAILATQAAWVLLARPAERRAVLVAALGAAALLLPWAIAARDSRDAFEFNLAFYDLLGPKSVGDFAGNAFRVLAGHPFTDLADLPGAAGVTLLCLAIVACLVDVVSRRRPTLRAFAVSDAGLLTACALAVPAALLIGDVVLGRSVFFPRSLAASLPAAVVCLAGLIAASRLVVPAGAVALGVVLAGTYAGLDRDHRRPDFEAVARHIDRRAAPGDPVLVVSLAPPEAAGSRFVSRNFTRPHPQYFQSFDHEKAWATGRRVFLVANHAIPVTPPAGFRAVDRLVVAGWTQTEVVTYAPPKG